MENIYSNLIRRIKWLTLLVGFIFAIVPIMILGIVVIILRLIRFFFKIVKNDVFRVTLKEEKGFPDSKIVFILNLKSFTQKIKTAINCFLFLFDLGLIHRVNQKEIVYHTIIIPSYIIL